MKTKKLVVFGFGLMISLAALLFVTDGQAFAATKTWDGGGSDNNMTTAANWNADSAPSAGDDLVFPVGISDSTITNDFTAATSFNSISFTGDGIGTNYTISGNSMTVVAGISAAVTSTFTTETISAPLIFNGTQTITVDLLSGLHLSGVLSGSGALTKAGTGDLNLENDNTFSGTLAINAGQVFARQPTALGSSSAGTTIQNGGQLWYEMVDAGDKNATIAEPLTINASTFGSAAALVVGASCGQTLCTDSSITLSGAIVLGADAQVGKSGILTLTGALSGAHTITVHSGDTLTLVINSSSNTSQTANGSYGAAATTTTYSDNSPSTNITVGNNQTAILTGTYNDATVSSGGIFKGTGTLVGFLRAFAGAQVGPGLSPGCLTIGSLQLYGGTFDAELGGTTPCSGYDQIRVNGTVLLLDVSAGSGILNTSIYGTFKPAVGNTFTIIDNDSNDAVTGTFTGLGEGATFTVGGVVFRISYVGGDGNDVVLTVLSVPAAPDTGFGLITSNPLITLSVTSALAGGVYLISRKQKLLFKK